MLHPNNMLLWVPVHTETRCRCVVSYCTKPVCSFLFFIAWMPKPLVCVQRSISVCMHVCQSLTPQSTSLQDNNAPQEPRDPISPFSAVIAIIVANTATLQDTYAHVDRHTVHKRTLPHNLKTHSACTSLISSSALMKTGEIRLAGPVTSAACLHWAMTLCSSFLPKHTACLVLFGWWFMTADRWRLLCHFEQLLTRDYFADTWQQPTPGRKNLDAEEQETR